MPSLLSRSFACSLALASLLALAPPPAAAEPAAAPAEIVAAAPQQDWVAIAPDDLLVMDLAPDTAGPNGAGKARRVVIQLLPAPFAQEWIGNIRKLAGAHWWDGTSVNRVQDNYVVQWGDGEAEDKAKARPLPPGLVPTLQDAYTAAILNDPVLGTDRQLLERLESGILGAASRLQRAAKGDQTAVRGDAYAAGTVHWRGWPLAMEAGRIWPIHCYGAVGVGRNMPPDAGTGAELYTVIGTPPRHLDRNIAVVGRVIEGIEHLASLPRGTGPLGFYQTAAERTGIRSIRLGSDVPDLPRYQSLSTESTSFAHYVEARANRRDAFFIRPAGGADICNLPVPVRRAP